jgi:hypothetical protein
MKFIGSVNTFRKSSASQGGMVLSLDVPQTEMELVLAWLSQQGEMELYEIEIKKKKL